ncbi:MAG TPA: hypothetical protein VL978_03130 [Puia sp.]|nr:hypothetical protein [Puia sp.]
MKKILAAGTTVHSYYESLSKNDVEKETHWYLMKGTSKDPLIGQLQESIEWVVWAPLVSSRLSER